ncbi:hypothetical protein BJB45_04030 [Halomonas huangheensis]|uniref:Uncharacterized protein n=1 Tax=Halomonas huangheensis TaxID=1178482 RepID=W1N4A0_9GAMM|nr:hypothetical protein BJB45_04030 [Halomonas huangheensis]
MTSTPTILPRILACKDEKELANFSRVFAQ